MAHFRTSAHTVARVQYLTRRSIAALPLVAIVVLGACGPDEPGPIGLAAASCRTAQERIETLGRPVDLVDFGGHAGDVEAIVTALGTELDALPADGDAAAELDTIGDRLDVVVVALAAARRASALGDVDAAHDEWSVAQAGDADGPDPAPARWWAPDDTTVGPGIVIGDCVLDLALIEPGVEPIPVTDPPTTDAPVTVPPTAPPTDPPATDPPSTDPVEVPYTIFDPTVTLLVPDGLSWYAYDEPSYGEFFDSLSRSEFDDQLEGVTVGELYDSATDEYAMLVREFYWAGEVAGTELATSLDDVYLQGVAESRSMTIGGVEGTYYVEDDGTSGWVGHVGTYSVVLQYAAGGGPGAASDAYVALNYG